MPKYICRITLLLFLSTSTLHCQVLIGTVTDSDYHPISLSNVLDTITKTTITCNGSGEFILTITEHSVLKISHSDYEHDIFSAFTRQNSDTIYLNFVLTKKVQLVQEVIVTSQRLKTVVDQRNVNLIDYLPFRDFIMTIKSSKSERILSLEGIDTTFHEFNLGKIRAKSLFEDCFGNVHLLTKDSSYQIWIDSNLHILSSSSRKKFDELVKPCLADFSDNNIFFNFSKRNRKYTLTSINKETKQKNFFFHLHDEIGESVATSHYWSIISYYYQHIPEHANMIALGVWDGNLLTLNLYDPEFDRMIVWYLKIRAVELNIQSFHAKNELIVFDQFSDSVHVFNEANDQTKTLPYSFAHGSIVFDVIHDRYTDTFYDLSISNGIYTLESINPVFNTTAELLKITIAEIPFAKNIKVFNDWVYFVVEENSFYGLHRIKMPIVQTIR